jgi:hypothetical protein
MPDAISIYASLITGLWCSNASFTISAGRFGSENGWFRSMAKFYGPRISGVTGTVLLVLTAWQFELRSSNLVKAGAGLRTECKWKSITVTWG